jgi:hypothetical protein
MESSKRVEAVGIRDPARAACGDSSETPANVVAAAQVGFFGDEQAKKGACYIAHADDG